jgi:hypothetical protein
VAWAALISYFSTDQFSSLNTGEIFSLLPSWFFRTCQPKTSSRCMGLSGNLGTWVNTLYRSCFYGPCKMRKKMEVTSCSPYLALYCPIPNRRRVSSEFRSGANSELRRCHDQCAGRSLWNLLDLWVWQRHPGHTDFSSKEIEGFCALISDFLGTHHRISSLRNSAVRFTVRLRPQRVLIRITKLANYYDIDLHMVTSPTDFAVKFKNLLSFSKSDQVDVLTEALFKLKTAKEADNKIKRTFNQSSPTDRSVRKLMPRL